MNDIAYMRRNGLSVLLTGLMLLVSACSDPTGQREFRAGLRELKRENFVRAKSLLEKAISQRPGHIDNAEIHNYLGIAAWRLGQFSEAMTAFEDSRRLNPNLVEPVYNMGVLSSERDDMRGAARYLNEAATMAANDPRPLEYLAEQYMQRGQWTLARNALYSALDRDPHSSRIYTAIAAAHVAMQQPDQAIESLMFALEANTRYAPALFNLAVVYDRFIGDADQARAYYKRYISVSSRHEKGAEARAALTRLDQQGPLKNLVPPPERSAEAETVSTPAEESRPAAETPAAPETPSIPAVAATASPYDALIQQAEERAQAGHIQPAIDLYARAAETAANDRRIDLEEKAYREAVRAAIDQPRAHALLGQHLYARGRYDQAARSFRQAATINADYAPAQLGLARLAVRNTEIDAAVVHYRRVMASDPTMADAFWEFAQVYDNHLGVPENTARAYRDFARAFPGDGRQAAAMTRAEELAPTPRAEPRAATGATGTPPLGPQAAAPDRKLDYRPPTTRNTTAASQAFNRASVYQQQQDWERAIFFYLRALENDDQLMSVFYNLGICYTMNGERDLAREAYRQAIRLQPGYSDAQYNLALLLREAGDEPAAVRWLEDIVKNQPNYAPAHYALGSIYAGSPQTLSRAKQHYERFLALAPNDRSAPAIRRWLQQY